MIPVRILGGTYRGQNCRNVHMSKFPRCRNVNVPKRPSPWTPRRRNVRSRNEPKLLSLAFSRHFFLKFFKLMMRAARHHVLLCLFSFYFRLVTFFRNFSKTKVLSIRYRQFCSVKLKLKFSQQIADPRSMFCFQNVHFGIANHWHFEF